MRVTGASVGVMCGRYATTRTAGELAAVFEAYDDTGGALTADYNVAPTDPVPVVRVLDGARALFIARWGLVPHWARTPTGGARMINARAETVATSRAYADAFAHRRCLVPADGWYEWVRRTGGGKQPYYLTPRNGEALAFAGIWSVRRDVGNPLLTCGIVTTSAIADLAEVHPRMPLMLPPERWVSWLTADPTEQLLAPPEAGWLREIEIRPVGAAVGDVRNDGPQLIARVSIPSESEDPVTPAKMTLF